MLNDQGLYNIYYTALRAAFFRGAPFYSHIKDLILTSGGLPEEVKMTFPTFEDMSLAICLSDDAPLLGFFQ